MKYFIDKLKAIKSQLKLQYAIYKICKCSVWFVDIPRTSSSSLKVELGNKYDWPYGKLNILEKEHASKHYFRDHIKASQIQAILGEKNWENIFTFSVIRNPWDRMVSIYFYRQKVKQIPQSMSFQDYLKLYTSENFSRRLKHPHFGKNIANMIDYVSDDQGKIIVDYIVRYENRDEDLQYVREKIDFPELGKLTVQAAAPKELDYKKYYDEESIKIVSSLFARDIQAFNYSF